MEIPVKREENIYEELPEMEVTAEDLEEIDTVLGEEGREKSSLINILHDLQGEYHYLPKELLEIVSRELDKPLNQVYSVATFFSAFFMAPLGDYRVKVCEGTTCFNEGAREIVESLERALDLEVGETGEDGKFSLMSVRCLGCCSVAPAMKINEDVYGELTPEKSSRIVGEVERKEIEITDELIEEATSYIKEKEGEIKPSEAARELDLTEEQFEKVIDELKKRQIIAEK